jgi:hypothetical protein
VPAASRRGQPRLVALLSLGALAAGVCLAGPSAASPASRLPKAVGFTFVDATGDANAVNDQGFLPTDPQQSTPQSAASDDITSVTLARLDDGRKVKGITVTMRLSADPSPGSLYKVSTASAGCSRMQLWLAYEAGGKPVATLVHSCPASSTVMGSEDTQVPITAVLRSKSITWTLLVRQFPRGIAVGTLIGPTNAESRALVGSGKAAVTAPIIDQTPMQNRGYRIGQ